MILQPKTSLQNHESAEYYSEYDVYGIRKSAVEEEDGFILIYEDDGVEHIEKSVTKYEQSWKIEYGWEHVTWYAWESNPLRYWGYNLIFKHEGVMRCIQAINTGDMDFSISYSYFEPGYSWVGDLKDEKFYEFTSKLENQIREHLMQNHKTRLKCLLGNVTFTIEPM